jgi:hypothetical protein
MSLVQELRVLASNSASKTLQGLEQGHILSILSPDHFACKMGLLTCKQPKNST